MESVNTRDDWDEAAARLLAFFSALEIGGVEHRARLAIRILDEARRRHGIAPALAPVEAAMDVAAEFLEHWFTQALEGSAIPSGQRVAAGLFAWRLTGAAARWPDAVLGGDPPAELQAVLASVSTSTGPDLAISSMTPREMDYGAMEVIAQETWHQFAWTPILGAAALWTGIFFVALYVYDNFFPR